MNRCTLGIRRIAVAALVVGAIGSVQAQQFPSKPLRWISPYAAGGGSDLTTRAVAQKLADALGQSVVVDNRVGASGKIAVELASRSPADGYTLVTITPSIVANQDVRDLAPITQMTTQGYVLIVHPSVPANSVKELIALAHAKPGTLNYGSAGVATMQHIAGAMLGTMTKTNLVHVPYKGGALALTDLLGGQLQFFFGVMVSSVPHIKSGKVKALAVSSPKRSAILPELPTVAEAGVPGYAVDNWYGVAAPAKTSPQILTLLNRQIVQALASSDVRNRVAQDGAETVGNSISAFGAVVRNDQQRLRTAVKEAGIKVE